MVFYIEAHHSRQAVVQRVLVIETRSPCFSRLKNSDNAGWVEAFQTPRTKAQLENVDVYFVKESARDCSHNCIQLVGTAGSTFWLYQFWL